MNRTFFGIDPGTMALIIGTIMLLAFGQVLFKFAADGVHLSQPRSFVSLPLIVALSFYGVATLAWLLVLSRVPLSVAFPFYGLTFFFVPLLAWLILKEPIRPQVIIGGVFILIGILISSMGSSVKG